MSGAVEGAALLPCPNPWCIARTPPLLCALKHDGWRVRCECGVSSWRKPTDAEAANAWNTRTTPPARSYANGVEDAAKVAENPGFIEARDTEWDEGVNYAKSYIAAAIRLLSQRGKA